MSGLKFCLRSVLLVLLCGGTAQAIGVRIEATSGGTLEDTILVASAGGSAPFEAVVLGDLDLSETEFVFVSTLNPLVTHWWLIGHQGASVVYSSVLNLTGVDLYDVEPYDLPGAEMAWNIPANLAGFATGGAFSMDWWAQTVLHHSSHVAVDGGEAGLWRFGSPGVSIGVVAVNLHSNDIPDGVTPGVPDNAPTLALVLAALVVLGFLRRR